MHDDQWLVTQNRVLQQFSAGEPLPVVLRNLAKGAERLIAGGRCIFMLADDNGEQLHVAAAPSMPDTFQEIGPMAAGGGCGVAAALRRPILSSDVRTDPNWDVYRDIARTFNIQACWSTPVLGGDGRVLGTFAVLYDQPHEPAAGEQPIVDTCTHLAGLVIDRQRSEDSLQAHARQQAAVARLGQLALIGEDLQALMEETVRQVATTLDVPMTKLLESEPDGKNLRLRAGVGWQAGLVGHALVQIVPESQAGYTLLRDEPVIVKYLPSETRFVGMPLLHDHGVISGMSVVVPGVAGQPWGVFGVHSPDRRVFTDDDINFLQSIAHLLSAAIQRKASERELQTLNETLEERVADRTAVAEHRAAQLRALAAELAQAERRERRRLSKLLHDHLQQLLVAAKLRVDALTNRRNTDDLADVADQIDQLLQQAIDASRSLTVELSPPILYDAGLPAAIEWLCRWMHDKHGLTVKLSMDVQEDQTPLASEMSVFLFDAVREMLFNVVKHAGVQEAEVHVVHKPPGPLRITVIDRGTGFDAATRKEADVTAAGFGLFNIQQRVQVFGGELDIHSQPGNGTRIFIELDLAADQYSSHAVAGEPVLNAAADEHLLRTSDDGQGTRADEAMPSPGPAGSGTADDGEAVRPVRVLVADDHAPLRKGLITLLTAQRDIKVVGEAVDGQMAIEAAQRLRPDVVLMDVHMPGLNGIEATRQLAKRMPELHIVGLSIEEHEEMARVMQDAGAVAYLPKGSPPATLFAAIRNAMLVVDQT